MIESKGATHQYPPVNTEPPLGEHPSPGELGEALYFTSGAHTLFGWLHEPRRRRGDLGLVICKPFGYESICAHRALRTVAEEAAAAGVPALRFDYAGTGDSADVDPDADQLALWVDDIEAAVDELKRQTGVARVCLLGVRLGGLLATLAARRGNIDALILIAPTVSGRRYLREFKTMRLAAAAIAGGAGMNLSDSGSMEVAGFSISPATVESLGKVDLAASPVVPAPHVLILDAIGFSAASGWAATLAREGASVDYRVISGPIEMVLTAPQFGMTCFELLGCVQSWLQNIRGGGAPLAVHPQRGDSSAPRRATATAVEELNERAVFIAASVLLFGIVTQPRSGETRRRAVILLSAAADYHIGPGRMYVSLARVWARHGYHVLRLDLAGLGDSCTRPGEPADVVFPPLALHDIQAAVLFMRTHYAIHDITLAGLCSGAYHALCAAMRGLPVTRILMVNPLNFFWDKDMQHSELKLAEVVRLPNRYRERLFSMRHWSLLLKGQVSLWHIGGIYLQRMMLAAESMLRDALRLIHVRLPRDLGFELERIVARGISVAFIFARGEPGLELLKLQAGSALRRLAPRCRVHIIDSGDHIFGRSGPRSILESILSEELLAPAAWYEGAQPAQRQAQVRAESDLWG
jgi:alpha-beta hydrolase superfamily lysophospholipase